MRTLRFYRLNIFIIILLNLLCTQLTAQQYLFDAQHLTTDDGLGNLFTSTIHQDSKGFIWIGTKHGLNRYDGYSFELFNQENSGLRENLINQSIVDDEDGNLWLTYYDENSGIACDVFNPQTGKAIPFETHFERKYPFDEKNLRSVGSIDSKNLIWVFTYSENEIGTLYFYKEKQFKKIISGIDSIFIGLVFDQEDNIWIATTQKLIRINEEGKLLETLRLPQFEDKSINGFWIGEDNDLWVTIYKKPFHKATIWKKDKNKPQFEPFLLKTNQLNLEPQQQVIRGNNGLWYTSSNNQIHVFDSKGEWLFNFDTFFKTKGLFNIIDYCETDGFFWLATKSGVMKLSTKESFCHLIQDNALSSDYRGITEDEAGNIYFLNLNLCYWNRDKDSTQRFSNTFGTYGILYKDSTIWMSQYKHAGNNLGNLLDLKTNKQLSFPVPNISHVYTLLESSTPNIYFAGHQGGLSFFDLKQKKILPFEQYNDFDELKSLSVFHLYKNEFGIWLATDGGIFLMTEEQGIIHHFDKTSGHLPFDHINHIYEDQSGVFWLASGGGGLIRWRSNLDSSVSSENRQFTTQDGLSNDYLYAVYEDDYNHLWIPSDKGLMHINKSTFRMHTYTTKDGLPHNEFNLTSHYQSKEGALYFGGLGGLITLHPKDIAQDSVYNISMKFTSCQFLKEGGIKMTDQLEVLRTSNELVVAPDDKFFELKFALLDFDEIKNHRYSYQIEGYNNLWHTIPENYIRIPHLPYGTYRLRIKGQNINKGWSEQELELKIRVLKPFYLQWWFLTLGIIVLLGIGFTVARWRIVQLKTQQRKLENEVHKRTQTIAHQTEKLKQLDKAKNRFFSNITHEFRTPLTLIIGPLEQVIENQPPPDIFKRRLDGVLKNAKHLLTLVNQLLDLSKLESGHMQMEVAKGDIINYTREFVKRFESLIEKKELRFKFVSNQERWITHFDKDKWDKIIYNLLSNALKFTPKGEVVQLSLMKTILKDKEVIRLDVKDTGVGIKKDQLNQIFNRFYQADDSSKREQEGTGIGLALVKELVELQGGKIGVSSRVNEGTSFEIYLPVLDYEEGTVQQALELPALPILKEATEKIAIQTSVPNLKKESKLELLIIEDNEEIREYIQHCLDTSKYNITEAVNGEDGILKAQSIIPDLIISDVMMPRKNGFEVVKEVRYHLATSHIPIIILTAKSSLESRLEGLKRGADAYLTKPFSPKELALRIQKLIELRQVIQQRYQNNALPIEEEIYQKEDAFISEFRGYILKNIDKPELGVDQIGRNFGMSRVHLYRKLKALTNQSTSVLVRQIRLERAKELLQEGKLNISEITYQTGFSSISYFSRSFKQAYGVAPSEM